MMTTSPDRPADAPPSAATAPRARSGGTAGNARLTALTGAVLLVLLLAEFVTIQQLKHLLYWHYFIGYLMIGPVLLKIGSTVYRFCRYYLRDEPYRRKGPPPLPLRVIGPVIVLCGLVVLGSGVVLGLDKQPRNLLGVSMLLLHKAGFVVWGLLLVVHVLAHLPRLLRLLAADWRPGRPRAGAGAAPVGGRGLRFSVFLLALGAGLAIALTQSHLSALWHR
jgi:hypothetical protein